MTWPACGAEAPAGAGAVDLDLDLDLDSETVTDRKRVTEEKSAVDGKAGADGVGVMDEEGVANGEGVADWKGVRGGTGAADEEGVANGKGAVDGKQGANRKGVLKPGLAIREGADGSFSLWSETFGEGFHSGRGALREARETFLAPSQLERFPPGARLRVVEVCVGTGSNLALLLEACASLDIALEWWGLELDPQPLRLALAAPEFRRPWQPRTLSALEELLERGHWQGDKVHGHMLWGDARQTLVELLQERRGAVDLIWHDAFSPRRCPQLWTVELLGTAAMLLAPEGRWISYSSAAAVRETLRLLGLHLVALDIQERELSSAADIAGGALAGAPARRKVWSGGTVASPSELGDRPPGAQSPGAQSPGAKAPGAKSPEVKSPEVKSLEAKSPGAQSLEAKSPEVKSLEAKSSEAKSSGAKTSGAKSPEA